MKSSWLSKIVSLALVVALLSQMLPLTVFASNASVESDTTIGAEDQIITEETTTPAVTDQELTAADVLWEEESRREETIKHFRLSDGSYVAVDYGYAVHYVDGNGDLAEIDNRLALTGTSSGGNTSTYSLQNTTGSGEYTTTARDQEIKFAATANDETLVTIGSGSTGLSMAPVTADYLVTVPFGTLSAANMAAVNAITPNQLASVTATVDSADSTEDAESFYSAIAPTKANSSIVYENIFSGVDVEYVLRGNDLKENIIIKQPLDSYSFPFSLNLGSMTPVEQEDGRILIMNGEEVAYIIAAPYMIDDAGEFSTDVTYEITNLGNGEYLFNTVANADWINDEARVFPVTVDPSISANTSSSLQILFVSENQPSTDLSSQTVMYVGESSYDYRMRLVARVLSMPTIPDNSTVVNASLHFTTYTYSPLNMPELALYARPISENNASFWDGVKSWNNCPAIDTAVLDYTYVSYDIDYYSFDITREYLKWVNDSSTNYGLTISGDEDSMDTSTCAVTTVSKSYAYPALIVTYRNNVGVEDYYTYQTQDIGRAGVGYIGDFSGGLTLIKADAFKASTVTPVTVSHIYNSATSASEFYELDETGGKYSGGSFGHGWKLSCMETVIVVNSSTLLHVDADGTAHYYIKDTTTGKYEDEDGLGLTITVSGSNYTMNDRYGGIKYFASGVLNYVQDANGNRVTYTISSNRVTSVTRTNNGGSAETIATMAYNSSGYLSSITDSAGNVTSFTYTSGNLTGVTHPDGTTVSYTYSNNRLTSAKDNESGYSIAYTYSTLGKVASYQEKDGTTAGASVTMGTVTDALRSFTYTRAGRTVVTYKAFDNWGRTINTYSTNADGTVMYGADSAEYTTNSGTNGDNNRVTLTSAVGLQPENLAFEATIDDLVGSLSPWGRNGGGTTSIGYFAHTGTQSIQIVRSASDSATVIMQTISYLIPNENYVLSAYVYVDSDVAGSNGKIFIREGAKITGQSATGTWARVSAVGTANSSGTLYFHLYVSGVEGTVYIDDLQVETCVLDGENGPSSMNLLGSGSFSYYIYPWTLTNATRVTDVEFITGTVNAIKMTGNTEATRTASQTVQINKPGTYTYIFSAWAKAESATLERPDAEGAVRNTAFDLQATITYADGEEEVQSASFCTSYTDWQFKALPIVPEQPEKTVASITVSLVYSNNVNTAYFTKASLVQEGAATYTYNLAGDLVAVETPETSEQTYEYIGSNLTSHEDSGSGVLSYEYDANHNVTSVSDGIITQHMSYSTAGNVTGSVLINADSSLGISSSSQYGHNQNLLTSSTDALGNTTSYNYGTSASQMFGTATSITDAKGIVRNTSLSATNGRILSEYISGEIDLDYTYSSGLLTKITRTGYLPNSSTGVAQYYNLTYGSFDQLTSIAVGLRNLATYTYESGNGLLQKMTYGNGTTVEYEYDELERISAVYYDESDSASVKYVYTGAGTLGKIIDVDNGRTYVYDYDNIGRVISASEYQSSSGELYSAANYTYDTSSRVTRVDIHMAENLGDAHMAYTYDTDYNNSIPDGAITSMTTLSGDTISYTYDSLGRLTTTSGGGNLSNTYTYKAANTVTVPSEEVVGTITGTVIPSEGLNIRSGPGTNYSKLTAISCGSTVTIHDTVGNWYKISYGNYSGYVYCRYVNAIPMVGMTGLTNYSAYQDQNLRSGPSIYTDLVTTLPDGTEVTVLAISGDWAQVSIGEITGYLQHMYIAYDVTETAASTTTQGTTTLVSGLTVKRGTANYLTYTYTYDAVGNITSVTENGSSTTYTYDEQRQLLTAVTPDATYTYTYDTYGNIRSASDGSTTHTYTYGNSDWRDLLTAYDGNTITYDTIGNPLTYHDGTTFVWQNGKELASRTKSGATTSYEYNMDGLRTKKTNSDGTYSLYYWIGNTLVAEEIYTSSDTLSYAFLFSYDATGRAVGLSYKTSASGSWVDYFFALNLQGDVVALLNSSGTVVAQYEYDPWGNLLSVTNSSGAAITSTTNIATRNPLRYRGYYYDRESGFYYLQSRYYDPEIKRFINADDYASTGQGFIGFNMFAYCGNNPINRVDSLGQFWEDLEDFISDIWEKVEAWAHDSFGAESSTTVTIIKVEHSTIPDPLPVTLKTGTETTETITKKGDSSKPISVYAEKNLNDLHTSSSAGIKLNNANSALDIRVGLDDTGIFYSTTQKNTTNALGLRLNLKEFKIGIEATTTTQLGSKTKTAYVNMSLNGWAAIAVLIYLTTGQSLPTPTYSHG